MSKEVRLLESQPNPNYDDVMDAEPKEVAEKASDLCLVDVRTEEEYHGELGHISGAQLLTLDHLADEISNLPKDETIVFICRSGQRSAKAAAYAKEFGFTNTYNLRGGMLLWNEKGYPVEK